MLNMNDYVYLITVTIEGKKHTTMFNTINDAYEYANTIKDHYDYILVSVNTNITSDGDTQVIDFKYHGI